MLFDISPLRMHPESFEHEQNIPASHKNVPEYLECTQNAVNIFLECTLIIKEMQRIFIPMAFWLIPALVWLALNISSSSPAINKLRRLY